LVRTYYQTRIEAFAPVAGDTVVLEYMQRGQLAGDGADAFPVLRIASVMQARATARARLLRMLCAGCERCGQAPPGP
jgi:hypothetical protein